MSFGDRMKEARKRKGLTQKELAQLVNLQESSVSLYEGNKREPRLDTAENIASVLGVSINWLLGRSESDDAKININIDSLLETLTVEKDWPEVINVLRRSGKKPTLEERRKIARIIKAAVADTDDDEE